MKKSKKITALVLSSMLTIGAITTLPYNVSATSIDFDSNNTVYLRSRQISYWRIWILISGAITLKFMLGMNQAM